MLKQGSHKTEVKNENSSNVFQYGHSRRSSLIRFDGGQAYKTDAANIEGDSVLPSISPGKEPRLSRRVFVNEITLAESYNNARTAFIGLHMRGGIVKKSSEDFPMKALLLIINGKIFLMNNQFRSGTQN